MSMHKPSGGMGFVSKQEPPQADRWTVFVKTFGVLLLLYIFLLSIGFIETGFKTAGKSLAEGLISSTTNRTKRLRHSPSTATWGRIDRS